MEPLGGMRPEDFNNVNTICYEIRNTNTKYACNTGQTRNKLLEHSVRLTNHTSARAQEFSNVVRLEYFG